MFKKGETVYYGTAGVCTVKDICRLPFEKNDTRMYYVLQPNDTSNSTIIYSPTDNDRVLLRPLMTKDEAKELISSIPALPAIEILNEKQRRDEYRNAMKDGTPRSIAMVIKTINGRKKTAFSEKKRISDTDAEFDKAARRNLFSEISCVLDITEEETESMISAAMNA